MQAAGIQSEYFDIGVNLPGHVEYHYVIGTTEGQPEVVKVVQGQFEDLLWRLIGVVAGEFCSIKGSHGHQALYPAVSVLFTVLWAESLTKGL